jgi:hypothetical protein
MRETPDPMQPTREREAKPVGSPSTKQNIPTPPDTEEASALDPGRRVSVVAFLSQAQGPDNAELVTGYGPRLVVLHDYLTGPGTVTTRKAFGRGDVIWASELLGDDLMEDTRKGPVALKRYLDLKAVREANEQEARLSKVVFAEGEKALTNELEATQTQLSITQAEAERLKRAMREAGLDPDTGRPFNAASTERPIGDGEGASGGTGGLGDDARL